MIIIEEVSDKTAARTSRGAGPTFRRAALDQLFGARRGTNFSARGAGLTFRHHTQAAYCDPGFFYETCAPLLLIGNTSMLCISTLTSDINF